MVLNNRPLAKYIPASTKARIRQIATELDYRPNIFARYLRSNRSYTVGVMVFDITDPYCTHTLRGIEHTLNGASIVSLLFDAQNKSDRFQRNLELMLQRRVDGLILVANSLQTDPSVLELLHIPEVPVVVIGRDLRTFTFASSVIVNNQHGGYMALEYLYNLGHRDIVFIRGPESIADSHLRWRGIQKFAKQVDLRIPAEVVLDLNQVPATSAEGMEAVIALLRKQKKRVTAVLAFDDLTALGAIRGLTESGLQVPKECSVIGFDDIDAAGYCNPPLTTIRQPMLQMGEASAAVLLEAINARHKDRAHCQVCRVFEPELVVRKSTAPPRRGGAG